MNVAIIPARGGSKRIPRKNIKLFCGKPMLVRAVEAARDSECFDRIVVSTDDDEIAALARHCGADVPFRRPPELSDDHTATVPVIAHAIDTLHSQGVLPDLVCCVYATTPFLQGTDLKQGLESLKRSGADYAFSATRYEFPIQRAIRITKSGRVEMFYPEHFTTRSQDLEPAYHDAAQFYWGRTDAWLSGKVIFAPVSVPVYLPHYRVVDIDTPEDWERAELMFGAMKLAEASSAESRHGKPI